jgi:hypothetical protein
MHYRTRKVTAAQSLHEAGQAIAQCRVLALNLPREMSPENDRKVPVSADQGDEHLCALLISQQA